MGVLGSTGCSVNVGAGATEIVSTLPDTCPGDVESSVTGSVGKDSSVTGPVVVDSSVTSSVVTIVVTMDLNGSVGTGGTEVG